VPAALDSFEKTPGKADVAQELTATAVCRCQRGFESPTAEPCIAAHGITGMAKKDALFAVL
jgi:hypothetical protein